MNPYQRFLHLAFWVAILVLQSGYAFAQHVEEPTALKETEEEVFRPHHTVSVILSHALVREGLRDGAKRWLSLPSWGLDYNYHFHPRWAIGLHTDLILEEFVVERHLESGGEGEVIERSFPIAPALVGTYVFGKRRRWAVLLGPGVEFASGESFFLTRLGLEYVVELPKKWEIFATLNYDIRWNAYDSVVFGVGVGKAFGHGKTTHHGE